MDASLVLLSQGIESTIEGPDEESHWQLFLDPPQYEPAIDILRLQKDDDRVRSKLWQQTVPFTGLLFDWRCLAWFVMLALIFTLNPADDGNLKSLGRMDSQAVLDGHWWRLFTAVSLHGDLPHLLANISTGVIFLGLAMGTFGSGHALLASFLAGAAANIVGLMVYSIPHYGLGASGMVMASLGLLAAQSVAHLKNGLHAKTLAFRGICGACLLLALLGFSPSTDVIAHVAGFIFGAIFGALMALFTPQLPRNEIANRISELATGLLVALTWALALVERS